MARAALFQSEIVVQNILNLLKNRPVEHEYVPKMEIEGSIKLTLGIVSSLCLSFLIYSHCAWEGVKFGRSLGIWRFAD